MELLGLDFRVLLHASCIGEAEVPVPPLEKVVLVARAEECNERGRTISSLLGVQVLEVLPLLRLEDVK